jgi:RHS repeat-associated protein
MDEVGVIHMNGRIYDPLIGRFLSADPFIQAIDNLQSHNRYAYVMNNPLAYTDPSGYFSLKKFVRALVSIAVAVYAPQVFATYGLQVAGVTAVQAAAVNVIATGALTGAISTGTTKGALQGALTAGLFHAASFAGTGANAANSASRYVAHAAAGCVSSVAGGGKCGEGAASAVFGKYTTNAISGWGGDNIQGVIARGVATSVAGGIGSVIAGGKFANGAETAAYGYLFNQVASRAAASNAAAAGNGALDPETANRRYARAGAALDRLIDKSIGFGGPEEYQYRLIANDAGNYPSVRGGDVWLERGDTYKIGTTVDPGSRYARSHLRNLDVTMVVETTGNHYQVLAVEKMELMLYFSRNLNLPPGNAYFK